jgi:hypothetical protein
MKNALMFVGIAILVLAASLHIPTVKAQSYGADGIGPIAPTVSNCPAALSGFAMLCPVGSGTSFQLYISYNGGAYAPLVGANVVTSVFGRTGAVVATAGDYSYAQLASPPTTVNCQSSGCTIK